MRVELDNQITIGELMAAAALIGCKVRPLPNGGVAIVKSQEKETRKCLSTPSSVN